jgi:putative pyruvate formate lyase activating enzyme
MRMAGARTLGQHVGSEKSFQPAYRSRLSIEELRNRAVELRETLRACSLCPRECGARRIDGRYGVCRSTMNVTISSAAPHFGEETPLTGRNGSGTIFFTSCNLICTFCQNYDISHLRLGRTVSSDDVAEIMLRLQRSGCHNINLVTPTHFTPQIVQALITAVDRGLSIPLVYNCGGYESVQTLRLLKDVVDIYMPDIKYSDNETAKKFSGAPRYWDVVTEAVREMHSQVGDLEVDDRGIAQRGLLIRHLVLPNRLAGSRGVLEFVSRELSVNSYINIMEQYRPAYRAIRYNELGRTISVGEYEEVLEWASALGLHRGFPQTEHALN